MDAIPYNAETTSAVPLGTGPEQENRIKGPIKVPSIADDYEEVLKFLDRRKRQGIIASMSIRYYDGWRPTLGEIADLVAVELGVLTVQESTERQRRRARGERSIPDITPLIRERHRCYRSP